MTIDVELNRRIQELQEEVWKIALDCLRVSDERRYRVLSDVALRLNPLISQTDASQTTSVSHSVSQLAKDEDASLVPEQNGRPLLDTRTIPIFARRREITYEAELDTSRISSGGRGNCVRYEGQWMTTSKAAGRITGTAVNGWQNFWKYLRDNGEEGPIQELRDQQLRSEDNVPW